ncbi:MAG TPA: BtpA/SgcQ family protein [Humisphaera sp.]
MPTKPLLPQWSAVPKVVIGMLHLRPLPGSPRFDGNVAAVRDALLRDAEALAAGGVHGLMVENFGDVPFFPRRVPAYVVAHMTALAAEVRRAVPHLPLGVNVLRNDGLSALAVAHAAGAQYVRVNVLCGARVADQGVLQGIAHDLLRERAVLGAGVRVLADVDVKHSAPLAARPVADEVDDTLHRGLADGLVVSGAGTGKSTDPAKVSDVKQAAGDAPVFVGSGVTAATVAHHLPLADGLIVGTALKRNGDPAEPVEVARVRELMGRVTG